MATACTAPVRLGSTYNLVQTRSLSQTLLPAPRRAGWLITRQITPTKSRNSQFRKRHVTMGLPIPIIGPLFNPLFLTIAYGAGAARFYSGFNKTTFDESKKAQLIALWPLLFATSEDFRKSFKKAIE